MGDDLYGNFDAPAVGHEGGGMGVGAQLPPPTALRDTMNRGAMNPLLARPGSQYAGAVGAGGQPTSGYRRGVLDARPMTSNRASGFNAQGGLSFDVNGRQGRDQFSGPAPPLETRVDTSDERKPEEECNELERRVSQLVDESSIAAMQGDLALALEKAKEAGKKERFLSKKREQHNLTEQHNAELTYATHFNLACQFHKSGLLTEANNTYSLIVRNKQYQQAGRLRVNMGNIYVEQQKYSHAVKMYKLALEDIPHTGRELRFKIVRNIGNAYVKMMNYKEAAAAYESIMDGLPDVATGFNLLLCYYALGEIERLKRCFIRLLGCKVPGMDVDEEDFEDINLGANGSSVGPGGVIVGAAGGANNGSAANNGSGAGGAAGAAAVAAERFGASLPGDPNALPSLVGGASGGVVTDVLKQDITRRRGHFLRVITTAARLVGPAIDRDWRVGYDWVIEQLKQYEIRDPSAKLASELEMCKALNYLKFKKYREAIDGLRAFEKKDRALRARAATNLSYLHYLEKEMENGEKWANIAIEADRYNPRALVNKGNFLFQRGELDAAKRLYEEAVGVEADNVEAIFNLGLVLKRQGRSEEALTVFKRLLTVIDSVEVVFQIADIYQLMGDHRAGEWLQRLVGRVPHDPNVLSRLGQLALKDGEESQAYGYYLDAYRYFQVDITVITWLGAYFYKNEAWEKALSFFQRAHEIETGEVKWRLMMGSCLRRRNDIGAAKAVYEDIHAKHPDNVEAIKHLVHICKELELIDESNEYAKKMRRLEVSRPALGGGGAGGGGMFGSPQADRNGGGGEDRLEMSSNINNNNNNASSAASVAAASKGSSNANPFGVGIGGANENDAPAGDNRRGDVIDLPGL